MAASTDKAARILIVDDDERNLLALSQVLEPVAEVVCAASGRDALRELLKGDFAVILLDVFMPGMDGYETAALIRQREQTGRIPIIFLSAVNKETEHLMRGYGMGAVDYVFKPVDPMILRSKVSVFVDLFDMRRQLEDSERRQATILRALPMAIYEAIERADEPVVRQFVGGDLTHFLGAQADSVLTGERDWQDWIHPEDRQRLSLERTGDAITMEYRWIGPDGTKRHLLDQRVATSANGSRRRWAGTLLDVTAQKELEAQLVHAGKLDALGQLTGGVAHDFNNLLAAMLSGISILERRLEIGEREQMVIDHMRNAATHGSELVRRMMAFARQQDLSPTSIDPGSLCDSVAGLVDHTLGGLVTVEWRCPERRLNLFVDRSQLELALMNLIINARDAMPGGGEIQVSIDEVDEPTDERPMLRIRVADSGCGIPHEVLAKITEPFFTTKETGKGTGLGLSMVSGFVHQSGGELHIDSAEGRGTTVDLLLPATADAPPGQYDDQEAGDAFSGKHLLLIDDDEGVRSVLAEQFRDAGAKVEDYARGEAAIEAVARDPSCFDFVLCDFAMPGLDGLETLGRIAELAPGASLAIMTGNADDPRLANSGSVVILRKPLQLYDVASAFGASRALEPAA
jgi:signal transduction histidine kinase